MQIFSWSSYVKLFAEGLLGKDGWGTFFAVLSIIIFGIVLGVRGIFDIPQYADDIVEAVGAGAIFGMILLFCLSILAQAGWILWKDFFSEGDFPKD